jgi:hypothetical protein
VWKERCDIIVKWVDKVQNAKANDAQAAAACMNIIGLEVFRPGAVARVDPAAFIEVGCALNATLELPLPGSGGLPSCTPSFILSFHSF